ncbi:MAG: ATP-binding cassette domain-containing protein [Actinomycetota bacterium]|nr:ATP-binding cassette domain-containing protein [Actinomycetota bacterium]
MARLRIADLHVAYGSTPVLHGVSLDVDAGRAVALVGPNGAGKTSLLRAVAGLLGLHGGRVTGGAVEMSGTGRVGFVLAGRRLFHDLTVEENLRVGGHRVRGRAAVGPRIGWVLDRFPLLAARRDVRAGYLSGGEQQLLAIATALVPAPGVLLLDEPAIGLADAAVALVADVAAEPLAAGTAVLVAEQEPQLALALGTPVVHLAQGRMAVPARA